MIKNTKFWCSDKRKSCEEKGTCADCPRIHKPREDKRPSSAQRGYGYAWRKIRAEVLTSYGIAQADWNKYVVDHRPPYNPTVEPNHRKYTLVPMLKQDHSRKTSKYDQYRTDSGFGKSKGR